LEFPTHTSNYTSNNDLPRKTGMEFMLNKMILSGDYNQSGNAAATIPGLDLLFTNDLQNAAPQIANHATNSGSGVFSYNLGLNMIMYHDLILTGNGSAPLTISGQISSYYASSGLIKSGTSTVTLTANNNYTGDTTVEQGTLSMAQPNSNNQNSSVRIAASGATLNLTFGGTDTVEKLFIGGVQQPAGVYEAVGNPGGGTEISQITGTGTLTVTADPLTGYNGWSDANAPGQTAEQDHDFDHVQNGIEYFMGESGSGFTALPSPDGSGTVTWTMGPDYAGIYGTDYEIESSTPGLDNFQPVAIGDVVIVPGVSVAYTMPTATESLFVRLRVTPE
jgi:autotransporter-associated beta strand protein